MSAVVGEDGGADREEGGLPGLRGWGAVDDAVEDGWGHLWGDGVSWGRERYIRGGGECTRVPGRFVSWVWLCR